MDKEIKSKWPGIALVIILLMVAAEVFSIYKIQSTGMLPSRYLIMLIVAMGVATLVIILLLMLGAHKKARVGTMIRRAVAVLLALCLMLGSLLMVQVLGKVSSAVSQVTDQEKTLEAMFGVYVKADDSAESLADAADYTFGIIQQFETNHTQEAITKIEKSLGKEIKTTSFDSMTEAANALLNTGEVDALIMNEAYVSLIEEDENYQDFDEKTKILEDISIEKGKEDTAEADKSGDSDNITVDPFCVYISGSDTRSAILDRSNSDVNILMVVNPSTKQILLLNTPRDYFVSNPAATGDVRTMDEGDLSAMDKLTHCGIYGVECSMGALEYLYDTHIDYYGQINFTGFEKLIDDIGGVTVTAPEDFTADGYSYKKGENYLNGAQALAFARERHSFASGDNQRGLDQMEVITAVINKVTSSKSTVLNNYEEILNSLSGMISTDLTSDDIRSLIRMQLEEMPSWNIKQFAVTGQGGSEVNYSLRSMSVYVMYQNAELVQQASDLIKKVENGEVLTDEDVSTK